MPLKQVDLEDGDDKDEEEEAEAAVAVLIEQGKEVAAEASRASGSIWAEHKILFPKKIDTLGVLLYEHHN